MKFTKYNTISIKIDFSSYCQTCTLTFSLTLLSLKNKLTYQTAEYLCPGRDDRTDWMLETGFSAPSYES